MKRIAALFLFILLLTPVHARAMDHELRTGMITGHPEWLSCSLDSDCALVTTKKCALQMAVNTKFTKQADEAASAKLQCTTDFPAFVNPRAKCGSSQCLLVIEQK